MRVFETKEQLRQYCSGFFDVSNERVIDPQRLRQEGIDALVWSSVFGPEDASTEARRLIYKIAFSSGIFPASIHELYMAMGSEEVGGFTVPAMNIRGMTYDIATRVFEVARELRAGAFIFEIAKSEMAYTGQEPSEYATSVLAGAIKAGYRGPVFIQGDHFQAKRENFLNDHNAELQALKTLISSAIGAGFFNIDIDASTLVDYSKPTLNGQQEDNFTVTALLTEFIRDIE
ncbi:MAG: aldolase, partial [Nitrospirae bacterium]